jgi:DNA-binding protein HU-beta
LAHTDNSVESLLDPRETLPDPVDTVTLVGLGTFKVIERKARKGRNPQTAEEIDIKASKATKLTPGKALKEAVK